MLTGYSAVPEMTPSARLAVCHCAPAFQLLCCLCSGVQARYHPSQDWPGSKALSKIVAPHPSTVPVLQALRIAHHTVVSNRTGIPLQLMHASTQDVSRQLGRQSAGTLPAARERQQGAVRATASAPGLRAALPDTGLDWQSSLELPAGKPGCHRGIVCIQQCYLQQLGCE